MGNGSTGQGYGVVSGAPVKTVKDVMKSKKKSKKRISNARKGLGH